MLTRLIKEGQQLVVKLPPSEIHQHHITLWKTMYEESSSQPFTLIDNLTILSNRRTNPFGDAPCELLEEPTQASSPPPN